MRRDIQKEQVLAVGAVSKSVGNLKSEIDLLSEKESKRNGKFRQKFLQFPSVCSLNLLLLYCHDMTDVKS